MAKNDSNAIELLTRLRALGVEVRREDDRLRIDAPKGVLNSELRENLFQQKAEILRFLGNPASSTIGDVMPLQAVPRDGPLPLSFSQERLWFLAQFEPENVAYNISGGIQFKGQLRVNILERSLSEIVRRHEVLRTTFQEMDGKPVQIILPPSPLNLQMVDLRELPKIERKERAQRVAIEEGRRPFDLSKGPNFRAFLVVLGEEEYLLLISMHHIITDRWSLGILAQELRTLYQAFFAELPSPLPELRLQFADFATCQRRWLQGEVQAGQLEYWKERLGGELPVLLLPTDHPRPAVQTYHGSNKYFDLPSGLAEKLRILGQCQRVTLYMVLLAAFKTLLFRYTGQADFTVGTPIANRNRIEIEGLIGFFVNTLVLRTDLSDNPSFVELLGRVRETTLGAYEHQDTPFEKLVEILNPARDMSYSPLFQVMFVFQNVPVAYNDLTSFTFTEIGASMFDLTLYMEAEENGLAGRIEYNTDLFDAETVERMTGHFEALLESITKNPDLRLSELGILAESERHQLLVEWNATEVKYPGDKRLHELFEAQVERTPEAVALVFEGKQLTYRELNGRANQLAHHLRTLGVGPEVLVGIFMERSFEMVIAIYGILKAGGAYVPLDPEYPPERIAFMARDTQVPVLLTQRHLMANLPEHKAKVICLDSDWSTLAGENSQNLADGAMADNLAYVIYTSGSTGMPKGAMNTHRGICNRLLWMQDEYKLTDKDRVMQKTPFSFDVSVWEFFWPLVVGGRLIVARPGGHKDSNYLVKLIQEQEITTLHFVPSMLQVFLDEKEVERCCSLKRVICSGEALPYELQKRFFAKLPAELHNLYGPTEAAVDVSYWACKRESGQCIVPIGYPVANTQLYILDSHLQPVPIGVTGELYIGGVQVGRGYLNRPELTAEKFIPDPFSRAPGARLYRTGDLARHLSGGEIEYLGRTDHQVKIRGVRIEPGEIEAMLEEHEALQKAVVMAREDVPGDKRLVGYLVPKGKETPSVSKLRQYLKEKLPEYMVPSAFVMLEKFPLTPNGKIDRNSLPPPTGARPELNSEYIAPRTEIERTITAIWQSVLRGEVGIHDNFFEMGGHSLLATQVVSRINKAFRVHLPLRSFFEKPTISELSKTIEEFKTDGAAPQIPPIVPISRESRRMKIST